MTDDTTLQAPAVFALPAALLSQGFALRPERDDDIRFLLQLYATTRALELAQAPWSPEQKQAFVVHQFQAQRYHYRTTIPNCRFEVLEHRGAPVGRLYLEPRVTCLNIVDIVLLPAYCGRGIGGAIFDALKAAAADRGRGVSIMVEKFNPALRLYRRLGFVEIADHEVYLEMEWMPARTRPATHEAVS